MTSSADLASRYLSLQARISTDHWTQPFRLADHRRALRAIDLNSQEYPRPFSYRSDGIDEYLTEIALIEQDVRSCESLGLVANHVAEQLSRDFTSVSAVRARDDSSFSAVQRGLLGIPPEHLVFQAKESLDSTPSPDHDERRTVSSEALAQRMTDALCSYTLTDWYVEVEENMAARASVNGSLQRVRVRANELFSPFDADRLMVHEIGGHVLRWANSRRQPEPWAKVPLGRTVPTEEGLAIGRESEFGLLDHQTIRRYQVRCLAVSVAAHSGIMEVMRAISPYVGRNEAVEIAIRTKRGLVDPNSPGGTTKDWGYYDGYLRMRNLRETSPSDYELRSGVKWPAEYLPLILDLSAEGRIVRPSFVPLREQLGLHDPAAQAYT